MSKRFLLDLNVLIALLSEEHEHHRKANNWFASLKRDEWGVCPLTEAGFVRIVTNPAMRFGGNSFHQAGAVLADLAARAGYRYWPITESWASLTAPVAARIFGHQQVADAYLLGLAIKENGVLATFDKGIEFLAGTEFHKHVLLLETP